MPRRKVDEMRLMATRAFMALLAGVALLRAEQAPPQQAPPQQPTPQFRAGVELTRIEVTVLDRRTRKPVRGLTPADFRVKVNGRLQPVASVAEIDGPSSYTPATATPAFREAAHDVVSNEIGSPRLFAIVMNDSEGSNDPFERKAAKDVAHRIIDSLELGDLAAVIFTVSNQNAQDFTSDRTLLRRAVETYIPKVIPVGGGVLNRVRNFLSQVPGYRRSVFYIASGGAANVEFRSMLRALENSLESAPAIHAGFETVGQLGMNSVGGVAHVPVYLFSTAGLMAPGPRGIGRPMAFDNDSFLITARATGGRAIINTNAPALDVPAVFEELSSYYVVAYKHDYRLDGALRWLQVDVERSGVMVMPSSVPFGTPDLESGGSAATRLRDDRESGLTELLASPLPTGDLPLRLTVAPFAVPSVREQAVTMTLALPAAAATPAQYTVDLHVFDGEGRRAMLSQRQQLTVPAGAAGAGGAAEVVLRVPLRPGRYAIRLGVQREGGAAGLLSASVTVPNFSDDVLSLSGVAIGRAGGTQPGGHQGIADVLPFAPTALRMFAPTDRIGALLRVHQRARGPAQAVVIETEIMDVTGATVHTSTRTLSADAFTDVLGVDHQFDLPLAALAPGDYLLRFVATAGERREQRDVRFSVGQR
jgi:VWFA-related protein